MSSASKKTKNSNSTTKENTKKDEEFDYDKIYRDGRIQFTFANLKATDLTDEYISIAPEEDGDSLHIKEPGAHATAWKNTRGEFLKEYGFDENFFEDYKAERKQAEKDFIIWKEERKKEKARRAQESKEREAAGLPPIKYPDERPNGMDLWRHTKFPDEE